ncbi:lipid A deacylase LpxR family protein [Telmatospirillum sp.]|uniref:lipid A deacylase LpxR family protein n=1 Tax=Telmatospirillum sp. TaxID=2079197 RepID=UPI0028493B7F|nr:lipid A deacylase LpxR family protein [Telmatospirillum sp.]MDR3440530.1 lipid A deacylase LpxR family protein [Telmatospirillum sp.]
MLFFLPALAWAQMPPAPQSDEPPNVERVKDTRGIFTFSLENDLFADADRHYTNGVRFSYLSAESDVPDWLDRTAALVPMFGTNGHRRWGASFGQSMYAPSNLTRSNPDQKDQPYAGWLYGSVGVVSEEKNRIDILEVDLGMVGPASLADQTQKFVHSITGSTKPEGWHYQLRDEPGIVIAYQRKWRALYEFSEFGLGADVTPYAGADVGNVLTQAAGGATLRIGYDLPADYGPPRVRPSLTGSDYFEPQRDFGWYLFAGVEGRAVARDIFLDGNTFTDSRSVDKRPLVGDLQFGVAMTVGSVRLAYTHVFLTKEFYGERHTDTFGSFSASVRF